MPQVIKSPEAWKEAKAFERTEHEIGTQLAPAPLELAPKCCFDRLGSTVIGLIKEMGIHR